MTGDSKQELPVYSEEADAVEFYVEKRMARDFETFETDETLSAYWRGQ